MVPGGLVFGLSVGVGGVAETLLFEILPHLMPYFRCVYCPGWAGIGMAVLLRSTLT